jgi:hypothetical protein
VELNLKYNTLNGTRRAMCPLLATWKNDFYLAGGTGLALQIGHRISEDFDFFTNHRFDNTQLLRRVEEAFHELDIVQLQNEEHTLTLMMHEVKISFFFVEPDPVTPLLDSEYFRIASVPEIGVFKLIATLRAAFKDYVDLFFILQQYPLNHLFALAREKYPGMDEALYLKAMLSYDDVDLSPIRYVAGFETAPKVIFESMRQHVDRYLKESVTGNK